jgi:phosphonate transport system substrate-binding protein
MRYYLALLYILLFSVNLIAKDNLTLDARYSDKNHDLLADTPKNPSKWIDPPYLTFAYAPHESPNLYYDSWSDFVKYLSKVTGKRVVYFPYQTKEAQLEAMRYGKLHISGFNTGMVPLAVNYAGFHPFAIMANSRGKYGYTMEIIANKNSNINTVYDLKGKKIAFTSPGSNSGYRAPQYLLERDFKLRANIDYDVVLSGNHANSIKGVASGKYSVAAVASSVMLRMINRKDIDANSIVTIYKSKPFPTTAYGYVYNLKPELIKKIKYAFLTFPWSSKDGKPSSLKKEFKDKDKFIEIKYKDAWRDVLEITKRF